MVKLRSLSFLYAATCLFLFAFCTKKNNLTPANSSQELANIGAANTAKTVQSNQFQLDNGLSNVGINPHKAVTYTSVNPSTQNSSINIGGAGWYSASCASTNSLTLKAINGPIDATIYFLFAPNSGTYAIAASPLPGACSLSILNAPNQPANVMWYGKTGQVVVNVTSGGISATLSNIQCTQQNFNFPVVVANGNISCN